MDYSLRIWLLPLLIASMLTSCSWLRGPVSTTEVCSTVMTSPMPFEKIAQLQQSLSAPVAALDFSEDRPQLIAIYGSTKNSGGQIIRWNLASDEIGKTQEVSWLHPKLTRINAMGNAIATVDDRWESVGRVRRQFRFPERIFAVIEIRDEMTGQLTKIQPSYHTRLHELPLHTLAISRDGQYVLTLTDDTASIDSTDPAIDHGLDAIHPVISEDLDYIPDTYVAGAFDQRGQILAVALGRGAIEVYEFSESTDALLRGYGKLYPVLERGSAKPVAVAIDHEGKWLAVLRTNSIELRNLHSWFTYVWPPFSFLSTVRIVYDLPATESGLLAFRPQGDLLAIGTPHGWQLRRSTDLSLVMEQTESSVTALAFSDDGCYVAFGEESGLVQVWALSQ